MPPFNIAWLACAVASVLLALQQVRVKAWRTKPSIFALACWSAVTYPACLWFYSTKGEHAYFQIWPVREGIDLAFFYLAVMGIFRRQVKDISAISPRQSDQGKDMDKLVRLVLNVTLGAAFLISAVALAFDAHSWGTRDSHTLIWSHAGALLMGLFLAFVTAWFKIIRQTPSFNARVHIRCLIIYLFTWSISRICMNEFPGASLTVNICSLWIEAAIFGVWAACLRKNGNERPIPNRPPDGSMTGAELIAGLRELGAPESGTTFPVID